MTYGPGSIVVEGRSVPTATRCATGENMKLYLSSYLLGDHADRLIAMAGRGARMAVITNALDAIDIEGRLKCTRTPFDPVAYFAGSGFDASLVDLRYYF